MPDGTPSPPPARPPPAPADLERYRQYLHLLARSQIDPRRRDAIDLSGVVQQTFLDAHQNRAEFRGTGPEQTATWLRQILSHNLADAMRGLGAAKRDHARQRSLEDAMAKSSAQLGSLLAADQSSPSLHLQRE